MSNDFQPAEEMIIDDLEVLKVLTDPLRLKIVHHLRETSTVKIVSEKLGRPPTKLYYHFNLLEKNGLIKMVDTRIVSGIVEKHYRMAARRYHVARGLFTPAGEGSGEGLEAMFSSMFSVAQDNVIESMEAGLIHTGDDAPRHKRIFFTQGKMHLTNEQADTFYERLESLLKEFGELELVDSEETKQAYNLTMLLHPTREG